MVYLEYHLETKQVVEIHQTEPMIEDSNYDYCISNQLTVGDEFEKTIWINSVDEDKNVTSFSAIRNNPQAKRLLKDNEQLKVKKNELESALLEMTTLSALQEQRAIENENAILELTMLIAGGNA